MFYLLGRNQLLIYSETTIKNIYIKSKDGLNKKNNSVNVAYLININGYIIIL